MLQLVEVDRYDAGAAVGKLDGLDIVVADAAPLVGKRVKVRVERVLDGRAYAVAVRKTKDVPEPLTAEGEAEKPTRKPPARKGVTSATVELDAGEVEEEEEEEEPVVVEEPESDVDVEETAEAEEAEEAEEAGEAPKPKKKTRRGSRGGRRRKKPAAASQNGAEAPTEPEAASEPEPATEAEEAPEAESPSDNGDFEYVPMSEWVDEIETGR